MPDQFVLDNFYHATSQACITDLTPPTFAGITGLSANSNGSLTASWSAATDANTPINYEVYIQAGTATGLFNTANRTLSTFSLSRAIFTLTDGSLLLNGVTYYVGVRARDPLGNLDVNSASLNAVSQGVPESSVLNAIAGIWDQLRASHTVSGSFGEALQGILSVARAGNLDNLNATISSRAAAATALDNTIWTNAKAAFIDAAISSRATPSDIASAVSTLFTLINSVPSDVWEELLSSHTTAGTMGKTLRDIKNLAAAGV